MFNKIKNYIDNYMVYKSYKKMLKSSDKYSLELKTDYTQNVNTIDI